VAGGATLDTIVDVADVATADATDATVVDEACDNDGVLVLFDVMLA
jgi:hypothetical protein